MGINQFSAPLREGNQTVQIVRGSTVVGGKTGAEHVASVISLYNYNVYSAYFEAGA